MSNTASTRYIIQSELGHQWHAYVYVHVRSIIVWNGAVNCACILCNIMAYFIHFQGRKLLRKGEIEYFAEKMFVDMNGAHAQCMLE